MNIPKCYCGNDLLGLFLKLVVKYKYSVLQLLQWGNCVPPLAAKGLNTVTPSVQI